MRAIVVTALVAVLALAGTPAFAESANTRSGTPQQPGATHSRHGRATVAGVTKSALGSPLPNQRVRLRDVTTGKLIAQTVSDGSAAFAFHDVMVGEYLLEMVNAAGYIIGVSPVLPVTAGASLFVPLVASASGAVAAAGGGLSLFGLGKAASVAVLAAAGSLATAGVVVARRDASVSR